MHVIKLQSTVRLVAIVMLPLIWLYPAANAWAETVPETTSTSSNTTSSSSETSQATKPTKKKKSTPKAGPTKPPGADSNSYTYNESSGLWENAHYTWDPNTNQTAPKDSPNYSYNPATNNWDTTKWRYDAPTGDYVPNVTSVSSDPTSKTDESGQPESLLNKVKDGSSTDIKSNTSGAFDLFYNAKISNTLGLTSSSGDATVAQNTMAGGALTGNAQAMANIINMLQSSWGPASSGQIATFINNIDGSVFGDLVIDPSQIPTSTLSASHNQANTNLAVNVQDSGLIDNQIDLDAYSGNALVNKNTTAGSATTGTAQAVANVVNMINSTIAGGKSFVGMININGSLNGDILLPPDMINQLLASNSVPKATIDTSKLINGTLLADFNNNQTINNQVTTTAASGKATVANNTLAGSATTGDASTNLTILNLTGQQIIGDNVFLVFVNVTGQWVGMIVNAPAGSTSAALGGGISKNTVDADVNLAATSNQRINNDINVNALSGDAAVTNNTQAGNATSGDASASVNLVNIINTQLSLAKWFGILFINVFGNWQGSFGVNTAAGNHPTTFAVKHKSSSPQMKVFRFVPTAEGETKVVPVDTGSSNSNNGSSEAYKALLANSIGNHPTNPQTGSNHAASATDGANNMSSWWLPIFSIIGASAFLGTERLETRRNKAKNFKVNKK